MWPIRRDPGRSAGSAGAGYKPVLNSGLPACSEMGIKNIFMTKPHNPASFATMPGRIELGAMTRQEPHKKSV